MYSTGWKRGRKAEADAGNKALNWQNKSPAMRPGFCFAGYLLRRALVELNPFHKGQQNRVIGL